MLNLLNKSHTNVHTIAYILGTVSIFGYVVSFVRDRVFAHYFGPSELLDIYIASFRIPDLLFIVVTAFLSVYAILPMFEEKQRQGRAVLKEFINTTFYFLLLFLVFGLCILFFAIPVIEEHVFTGFSGEASATFILFSRIFLVQATLFAISSFLTAILQLKRKFFSLFNTSYSLQPWYYLWSNDSLSALRSDRFGNRCGNRYHTQFEYSIADYYSQWSHATADTGHSVWLLRPGKRFFYLCREHPGFCQWGLQVLLSSG